MLNPFKKRKESKQLRNSFNGFERLWSTAPEDIWRIEDANDFLIAFNATLCRRCDYGEEIKRLLDAERTIYLVLCLEGEVNNGGFSQFFYNSSGKFASETAVALRDIGALNVAEIYERARAPLGELPQNDTERSDVLNSRITDEVSVILSECDSAFYEYPDDLALLSYRLAHENRAQLGA